MRHCMIVHSIYPYDETRVQREAEALIEFGNEVDVICLREGNEPVVESAKGVKVYRMPLRRDKQRGAFGQLLEYLVFTVLAFLQLTRLHIRRRYDVVQVHNLPDFLVFAAIVPRFSGSRVILDLHDLMPEFYAARFGKGMSSLPVRLVIWQEQLACLFAHHVITVTELWRQTLIRRGVAPDKCSVVMNLADTRYFDPSAANQEPAGPLRLIYHGTITRRYGLDVLLRALACARESIPDVHLTVHGRGEYLEEIRTLVHSLELEPLVCITTEMLDACDLAKLILSNHVGVVPYRRDVFTDGILPTKLMEYAALGRAVIAARTPAITAYFDENMVEMFAPEQVDELAKRIVHLYQHPERRHELARNVAAFGSKYNWPGERERYVHLVHKLANAKNARTSQIGVG